MTDCCEKNEYAMLEPFLKGLELYRVVFPDFWERSREENNPFYRAVSEHAHMFVELFHEGAENLESGRIHKFWHQHCEFCLDRAEADRECVFYCTKDMRRWICEACFEAHREQFGWTVRPSDELFK